MAEQLSRDFLRRFIDTKDDRLELEETKNSAKFGIQTYENRSKVARFILKNFFPWLVVRIECDDGNVVLLNRSSVKKYLERNLSLIDPRYQSSNGLLQEVQQQAIDEIQNASEKVLKRKVFQAFAHTIKTHMKRENGVINVEDPILQRILQLADAQSYSILEIGAGIENAGNSCYLASVVQGLRACPDVVHLIQQYNQSHQKEREELREYAKNKTLTEDQEEKLKKYDVIHLFENIMQSCSNKQTVSKATIQELRVALIKAKCPGIEGYDTQEDANCMYVFILGDILGYKSYVKPRIQYDFSEGYRINSIDCQTFEKEAVIAWPIGQKAHNKTVAELLKENIVFEEYGPENIQKQDPNNPNLKVEAKQKIETKQALAITGKKHPPLLAISLKRFNNYGEKVTTPIENSLEIEVESENTRVPYKLCAVTIHSGSQIGYGHYYTYVPNKQKDGSIVWVEYNDSHVIVHKSSEKVLEDIRKNGYVFMYEKKEEIGAEQKKLDNNQIIFLS